MQKIWFKGLIACLIILAGASFSACTFYIDGDGLVPEIIIETDNKLKLREEKYVITLSAGERYTVDANLGDYGEDEYYIEFGTKNETDLVALNGKEIIVSDTAPDDSVVIIVVVLKKQGEEKYISSEEITVTIIAGTIEE